MTETTTPPPTPEAEGQKNKESDLEELGKAKVQIGRGWYIPLSGLVGAVLAVISATYGVVQFIDVKPRDNRLEQVTRRISEIESDKKTLETQLRQVELKYNELLKSADRPILYSPPDLSSVVGSGVTFSWDDPKTGAPGYILSLRRLDGLVTQELKLNVPSPGTKRYYYQLTEAQGGEFVWRVSAGTVVAGQEVRQGEWSRTNVFKVYPTVTARIRQTGQLLVATTPTSYDSFVANDAAGEFKGFEIEFTAALAAQLGPRLGLPGPLKVKLIEIPWANLFTAMQSGITDVAVRSITRSAAREKSYPNLRFSSGYLKNHQVFVQLNTGGKFPDTLRGTTVGVKTASLNADAARYLSSRFNFSVDTTYTAYSDLYQALNDGRINLALVDSVLVKKFLGKQVQQFGPILDDFLKPLYKSQLGFDSEEYAVLVHQAGPEDKLRDIINDLISTPIFQNILRDAKKKYGID